MCSDGDRIITALVEDVLESGPDHPAKAPADGTEGTPDGTPDGTPGMWNWATTVGQNLPISTITHWWFTYPSEK